MPSIGWKLCSSRTRSSPGSSECRWRSIPHLVLPIGKDYTERPRTYPSSTLLPMGQQWSEICIARSQVESSIPGGTRASHPPGPESRPAHLSFSDAFEALVFGSSEARLETSIDIIAEIGAHSQLAAPTSTNSGSHLPRRQYLAVPAALPTRYSARRVRRCRRVPGPPRMPRRSASGQLLECSPSRTADPPRSLCPPTSPLIRGTTRSRYWAESRPARERKFPEPRHMSFSAYPRRARILCRPHGGTFSAQPTSRLTDHRIERRGRIPRRGICGGYGR